MTRWHRRDRGLLLRSGHYGRPCNSLCAAVNLSREAWLVLPALNESYRWKCKFSRLYCISNTISMFGMLWIVGSSIDMRSTVQHDGMTGHLCTLDNFIWSRVFVSPAFQRKICHCVNEVSWLLYLFCTIMTKQLFDVFMLLILVIYIKLCSN